MANASLGSILAAVSANGRFGLIATGPSRITRLAYMVGFRPGACASCRIGLGPFGMRTAAIAMGPSLDAIQGACTPSRLWSFDAVARGVLGPSLARSTSVASTTPPAGAVALVSARHVCLA